MNQETQSALEVIAAALSKSGMESPVSITGKFIDHNGVDVMVTVRNGSAGELVKNWGILSDSLMKRGFSNTTGRGQPVIDNQDAVRREAELNPQMAQASQPPQNRAPTGRFFEAETLVGSLSDGKEYWKVKGGKYTKYGVTIWEEVIQQAFKDGIFWDVQGDGLDVRRTYDLSGVRAYYVLNEKEQPSKVTRLERIR